MKRFCPSCRRKRKISVIGKEETYDVFGEPVTIFAHVTTCSVCGEEILSIPHDDDNLRRAYAVYRGRHHFLTPEEIRSMREGYGLSQRQFSRLLGLDEKSVERYERGALQSNPVNLLLFLVQNPENFAALKKRAALFSGESASNPEKF